MESSASKVSRRAGGRVWMVEVIGGFSESTTFLFAISDKALQGVDCASYLSYLRVTGE